MPGQIHWYEDFYSTHLRNHRTLRIYLPPSYDQRRLRDYPVLYVHDGQNVFDAEASYSGESWRLQETVDRLILEGRMEEIIMVAIDNMQSERLAEYAHVPGRFQGQRVQGKGVAYEAFLLQEVIPWVETHYRVKRTPQDRGLMGSSMGGLVSFWMGMRCPEAFGKIAALSPSFWWGDQATLKALKKGHLKDFSGRLWLDMGQAEGLFSKDFDEVLKVLRQEEKQGGFQMAAALVPDALHNEPAWAKRVHAPLLFLFGQVGEPVSFHIAGRKMLGQVGPKGRINPMLAYDSGFFKTLLDVPCEVEDEGVLSIDEEGWLRPGKLGVTKVTCVHEGLVTDALYRVIDHLSEEVRIHIEARVEGLDVQGPLYMGFFLPDEIQMQREEDHYTCSLKVKRDSILSFKFTRGSWETVEKDKLGWDRESRQIKADRERTFSFRVESI